MNSFIHSFIFIPVPEMEYFSKRLYSINLNSFIHTFIPSFINQGAWDGVLLQSAQLYWLEFIHTFIHSFIHLSRFLRWRTSAKCSTILAWIHSYIHSFLHSSIKVPEMEYFCKVLYYINLNSFIHSFIPSFIYQGAWDGVLLQGALLF